MRRIYTDKYWYDIKKLDKNIKMNHFYIQKVTNYYNNSYKYILRKIIKNYSFDILYKFINEYDYYPISIDINLNYYKIINTNNSFIYQKIYRKRKFKKILNEKEK